MFTKQALGAFLAGGVGTDATTGGQSDAQYTAKHAWIQALPGSENPTGLSIPSGDELTLTSVDGSENSCTLSATLNGVQVTYGLNVTSDGGNEQFQQIYLDSGTISCDNASTGALVGYLTPIPAG